ncbi:XPG domain containing-domain-containing protein [Lophiotrema nucula]|uniref:XPG domain containing-domain-containing protein n=1 Tax=Lophiotrema nucula TaxID=690887 RepID=A0A6A5YXW3_9PLEO|nr:XPG domain containing-domain-containing protein [Lophiotrema nucula]
MGISGLQSNLEPYALQLKAQELGGYVACIDGPGLAYHAYNLAAAADPARLPSYRDINATAIRWLKSLEDDSSIKVSAILFDGALPIAKRNERNERMQQYVQRMSSFRFNYGTSACPIPRHLGSVLYPLLAPAVREALSGSQYAQVTRNVPGEADDWIAAFAKGRPRSIVFTSDTDLLLFDYGSEAMVSFFRDATISPMAAFTVYSPTDIRRRLKLTSLLCLAYALQESYGRSLSENVQKAQSIDTGSATYLSFIRRYTSTVQIPNGLTNPAVLESALQGLDVRVSEFVHQSLTSDHRNTVPEVYLPALFEDTKQTSAWNLARDLRLLAYTLLVPVGCNVVREYTRRGQNPAPSDYQTYSELEAKAKISALSIATTKCVGNAEYSPYLQWLLLATQMILRDLEPPYAFLLARVLSDKFDQTWEYTHLHARVSATLYSLRILKQCISVRIAVNRGREDDFLSEGIQKLHNTFASFPTIADGFTVPGEVPVTNIDEPVLQEAIRDLYTSLGIEEKGLFGEAKSRRQRKREKREEKRGRHAQLQGQRKTLPQLSSNSFAVLGPG